MAHRASDHGPWGKSLSAAQAVDLRHHHVRVRQESVNVGAVPGAPGHLGGEAPGVMLDAEEVRDVLAGAAVARGLHAVVAVETRSLQGWDLGVARLHCDAAPRLLDGRYTIERRMWARRAGATTG